MKTIKGGGAVTAKAEVILPERDDDEEEAESASPPPKAKAVVVKKKPGTAAGGKAEAAAETPDDKKKDAKGKVEFFNRIPQDLGAFSSDLRVLFHHLERLPLVLVRRRHSKAVNPFLAKVVQLRHRRHRKQWTRNR